MNELSRSSIITAFRDAGAVRLFVKRLAANDNSKNQIYLGGNFELLNQIPFEKPWVVPSAKGRSVIHARVPLEWLDDSGSTSPASNTKLILYPQYPEVRLSGFLRGCVSAPNELLTSRTEGRLLFLGVTKDRRVLARVFASSSRVAREMESLGAFVGESVLVPVTWVDEGDRKDRLLFALKAIADREWITSVRLGRGGAPMPYHARNGGGYTLEAHLGITPNSRAEPDFEGYEIKQFGVADFLKFRAKSPITLFTPEPTKGYYADEGVLAFVARFGYADTKGRVDRRNFGGRFVHGRRLARTGLTLRLRGADAISGKIHDADGAIELVNDDGVVAAGWPFASLIEHWNRKHAEVAYVPSQVRKDPKAYRYASTVFLGYGTDFGRLMRSVALGLAFYDPGIKVEGATSDRPTKQQRSQFRMTFPNLPNLYSRFEAVDIG